MQVVPERRRGEDLDKLSPRLGVTVATLSEWRKQFLVVGEATLRSRAPDGCDDESQHVFARCHSLEAERPLGPRMQSA